MRSGEISVQDVPEPLLRRNFAKIATRQSLISPGAEKSKVDRGDCSLLVKAKARPDLVRKIRRDPFSDPLPKQGMGVQECPALGAILHGRGSRQA
jgi:hypothetical protein